MTQREQVLKALKRAGSQGICLADLPLDVAYCARNRVSELRADGLPIESGRCLVHPHKSSVARYRLAGKPEQLSLGT